MIHCNVRGGDCYNPNCALQGKCIDFLNRASYLKWKEDSHKNEIKTLRELLQKESSRTEEIAIGFSIWTEKNGWSWSIDHQLYLHYDGKSLGKTDRELFALYMESLKP